MTEETLVEPSSVPIEKEAAGGDTMTQSSSSTSSSTFPYVMFENLTLQPWHEIGNYEEERSISSTNDEEIMVEQITAVLASRLQDIVAQRVANKKGTHSENNGNNSCDNDAVEEYYRKNFELKSEVVENLKAYVKEIGKMYHDLAYHSLEHATHVTISTNKLLSMVLGTADMGCYSAEQVDKRKHKSKQQLQEEQSSLNYDPSDTKKKTRPRRSRPQSMNMMEDHASLVRSRLKLPNQNATTPTTDVTDVNTSEAAADRAHEATFGISSDPLLRFALVFSALIHDVDHRGVPNSTLVDEEDDLAIVHNDVSVAEQNSLRVAFSLICSPKFKLLKSVIMPNKESRKYFRNAVIHVVLQTDISNTERMQIAQSQWKEAFPNQKSNITQQDNNSSQLQQQEERQNKKPQQAQRSRSLDNSSNNSPSTNGSSATNQDTNNSNINPRNNFSRSGRRSMHNVRAPYHKLSPSNNVAQPSFGIRKSLDFTGKVFEAYDSSIEGTRKLRQDAVIYTLISVADVAHTMQSFSIFVKWNERLFRELLSAYHNDRISWDPTDNWYNNQIGFYDAYILPLAEKMKFCGVFGAKGSIFLYFAMENRRRWVEEGHMITKTIIKRALKDMMEKDG